VKLNLSLACGPYDRIWPIIDGRVPIEGCDINYIPTDAEEAFWRASRSQDFDITELSMSTHMLTTARGDSHYIGIPAFVSRIFRHSALYIRTDRGIRTPQDLRGRIVGVPEYQQTAALWVRGILSDEYGVKSSEIKWRNGGLNRPGRSERTPITLPPEIELKPIDDNKALSSMLESGEIDALLTARAPWCFEQRAPNVGRLFADTRATEEDYFRRTGMFPIMHLIGIRRSLVEKHPWLGVSVLKAFMRAREIAMRDMRSVVGPYIMLPWLVSDITRAEEVMGTDFWPYGIKANRKEIDSMLRWTVEQGLSNRPVAIEELFARGTENVQLKD
jgi:4,5-dihydroxyphthalate decarboxylase